MKKVVKKPVHKETEFEMLARLVQGGFARVDERFNQIEKRFEKVDERFEKVDGKFISLETAMNNKLELVNSQLFSINHELKEHTHRLDNIERKQTGVLANLDETVHRSEFKTLSRRVTALERKAVKK